MFFGDPHIYEQNRYEAAILNELGEKLAGMRNWQGEGFINFYIIHP